MKKKSKTLNLDYPYLSLPDIEENDIDPVCEEQKPEVIMENLTIQDKIDIEWEKKLNKMSMDYSLWEQNLEKEIQGIFDRQ